MIKHFFQERDCMTFVRPVKTEEDLKKLDQLEFKFMREEFVTQIQKAQKKIYKKIKPKKINDNFVSGRIFVEAAECYI